jgi:hypothetical protein
MSTVPFSQPTGNDQTAAGPSRAAIGAVAWHALSRIADKESCRDDLRAGGVHVINLAISGSVDGQPVRESVDAILTVGHDSERASSSLPAVGHLIAAILAKLNTATREAVLANLPTEFAQNGYQLPIVPDTLIAQATAMLVRLRATQTVPVRGSVACKYAKRAESPAKQPKRSSRRPSLAVVG